MDEVVESVSREDAAEIGADFSGHKGIETIRRCRVGTVLDGCKTTDVNRMEMTVVNTYLKKTRSTPSSSNILYRKWKVKEMGHYKVTSGKVQLGSIGW